MAAVDPRSVSSGALDALYASWREIDRIYGGPLMGSRFKEWVAIGPVVVCAISPSKKALKIKFEDSLQWVPVSQLHPTENEVKNLGEMGMLVIPDWLAKEKGWGV